MQLSPTQKQVLQSVVDWYQRPEQNYLTLGGYAGTGKTTLVAYFRHLLFKYRPHTKVAVCSYTGKAARMLKQKLTDKKAVYKGDYVGTIHRLIYVPKLAGDGAIVGWDRRGDDKFPYNLIIVDEASMLNHELWSDLQSFGVPILAVGDHGQLPPIEGSFNLMQNPQLKLEEIYRQQSDNPIIQASIAARESGEIPSDMHSKQLQILSRDDNESWEKLQDIFRRFDEQLMVLVGFNQTRVKLNQAIRELLEFDSPEPMRGDRVICLKNNHQKQIYNGMTGWIKTREVGGVVGGAGGQGELGKIYMEVEFDGEETNYKGDVLQDQFGNKETLVKQLPPETDLFDYGYALTVHKAQGSQARKVVVFSERSQHMDDEMWRRWLYTAVTRAEEELVLVR